MDASGSRESSSSRSIYERAQLVVPRSIPTTYLTGTSLLDSRAVEVMENPLDIVRGIRL